MSVDNGTEAMAKKPLPCTLIVQLSLSDASLNAVQLDKGQLISLVSDKDILEVPMVVALENETFYFGTMAKLVAKQNKLSPEQQNKTISSGEKEAWESFRKWDLGRELTSDAERNEALVVSYNNGAFVKASPELLFALFLRYLKDVAEMMMTNRSDLSVKRVSKFLICIPLWFPSKTRQSIKDAGDILGMDLRVVNQISLVAYLSIHFSIPSSSPQPKKSSESVENPSKILVFCENSDYVDMAYYLAADSEMQMVACTGSNCKLVSDVRMDKYRGILMVEDEVKAYCNRKSYNEKVRENLAKYLLTELKAWLPKIRPKNVLVIGQDQEWVSILESELYNFYNMPIQNTHDGYYHFGSIFQGIQCAGKVLDNLCGDSVRELYPQDLCWSELLRDQWKNEPFERTSNSRRRAVLKYPMDKIVIHENNVANRRFDIGIMSICKVVYFQYPQVEIEMELNEKEGIYSLCGVYGCKNGHKELLKTPDDYDWRANCLSEKEKRRLRLVIEDVHGIKQLYE